MLHKKLPEGPAQGPRSGPALAPRCLTSDTPHKSFGAPAGEPVYEKVEQPVLEADRQFVARVQPFGRGGYEGSCYWRVRDSYRTNPMGLRSLTPRVKPKEQKLTENANRARKRVRWLCREIAADHLVTFTTREVSNSRAAMMKRFERFVRGYRKATDGRPWLYVAVSEPHPTNPGHWHIHVACRGGVMIRTANKIWWAICGGRGEGNVDVKRFKTIDGDCGSMALARYISKYVVKGFGLDDDSREEGERRFRAAIIPLCERHKLIVEADAPELALRNLLKMFRLGRGDLQVFFYRDGSGFWFSCSGEVADESPPPF